MDLKEIQDKIQKFNDVREWSDFKSLKDLLLNMSEEIGEFWNIIKWVDVETQKRLIKENFAEAENFIGDMLYLTLKISYMCGVDSEKSIKDVLAEYEKRFPIEKVKKVGHTNKLAGGVDER
jgi:NTP pyrophosphatase (non-canonical NTP hydrolase)